MANLETTTGDVFAFDPKRVVMLRRNEKEATAVYGVVKTILFIAESPDAFLARLGLTDDFAALTRPDGSSVWINASAVSSVHAPTREQFASGVQTVVSIGSMTQGVREPPGAAVAELNSHGAQL